MVWTAERVTFQERSFLSTTGTVALVPIATGPNDTIEGLAVTASLLTPATGDLKREVSVRCVAGELDCASRPSQRGGSEADTHIHILSRKQDQRQAQIGRSEFGVAHRGSRDCHTRLSSIRHGDQQGFGLTDNDTAKSKVSGCANELCGSGAGAHGHHAEERDRQADG